MDELAGGCLTFFLEMGLDFFGLLPRWLKLLVALMTGMSLLVAAVGLYTLMAA